jgi:hypothetical protein
VPGVRLALAAAAAALAALGGAAPAAAQDCPAIAFLQYGGVVYAEEVVRQATPLARGETLGDGETDQPARSDPCRRSRRDATVQAIAGVDPSVAVAVEGRPDSVFVLGGRCTGFSGPERLACVREPLQLDGVAYTAVRYPDGGRALTLGDELGDAALGDETVDAVRIEGVDPALAVAVEARPDTAYVAPGVCPYERFSADARLDDMRRCLEAPLWLVFDPLNATAGGTITASLDRPLPAAAAGATLSLARLELVADAVPEDLGDAVDLGPLEPGADGAFPLTVPDVDEGVYEAVVRCDACAEAFGGTVFPAGSFLVAGGSDEGEGSSGPRVVGIALGIVLFLLIGAAIFAWWRGWWRPTFGRRRPPS